MCLAVYLASTRALPAIEWNEDSPAFYLKQESPNPGTNAPLSLPFVYYVGSHHGCGCGFLKHDGEDADEAAATQKDYVALAAVVRAAMANGGGAEVFVCWEGDQAEPPVRVASLTVAHLEQPSFALEELDLFRFVADG